MKKKSIQGMSPLTAIRQLTDAELWAQLHPLRALPRRHPGAEAREARPEDGTKAVSQEGAPVTRALYAAYTGAALAIAVGGWLVMARISRLGG